MEGVLGVGGVFFKARDPKNLAAWYRAHLGIPVEMGKTYATLLSFEGGEPTTWSTFSDDTEYFGPANPMLMINYRVRDLDAMLSQLCAAGVSVVDRVEDSEFGRFGWATDPEGNRFELWQPPRDGMPNQ